MSVTIDAYDPLMSYPDSCMTCVHFDWSSAAEPGCLAFPAIPAEIWSGRNPHTDPYPGDGGIVYRPIPANAARWKNPDDAAKHPKYPKGAEDGKGGQWAPKGTAGSTVTVDEYQRVSEFLLTGDLIEDGPVAEDSLNFQATYRGRVVSHDRSQSVQVFIKKKWYLSPSRGVHPGIPPAPDIEREMASDIANHMMGDLVRMGPTVVRDEGEGEMVVQKWSPGKAGWDVLHETTGQPFPWLSRQAAVPWEEWADVAVFDAVVGNVDSHLGNIRVDTRGRLYPVDHGLAWPEPWRGMAFLNGDSYRIAGRGRMRLNERQIKALRRYKEQMRTMRPELERWVGKGAVDESVRRVNKMLDSGMLLSTLDMQMRTWSGKGVDV